MSDAGTRNALRTLHEARAAASVQAKASVSQTMRLAWLQQTRLLENVIAELTRSRSAAQPAELAALREALSESIKLQSHYADLLNMHDGGRRLTFADADAWLDRLRNYGRAEP